MRLLRYAAVQRLFSVALLASLTLWLAAPAVAAQRSLAEELGLGGAEVAHALAEAQTPEALVEALAATLDRTPNAALMDLLDAEPEAILALLYGHLFRALGHHDGLQAIPATAAVGSVAFAGSASAVHIQTARPADTYRSVAPGCGAERVQLPVAFLTAAQPLGP